MNRCSTTKKILIYPIALKKYLNFLNNDEYLTNCSFLTYDIKIVAWDGKYEYAIIYRNHRSDILICGRAVVYKRHFKMLHKHSPKTVIFLYKIAIISGKAETNFKRELQYTLLFVWLSNYSVLLTHPVQEKKCNGSW